MDIEGEESVIPDPVHHGQITIKNDGEFMDDPLFVTDHVTGSHIDHVNTCANCQCSIHRSQDCRRFSERLFMSSPHSSSFRGSSSTILEALLDIYEYKWAIRFNSPQEAEQFASQLVLCWNCLFLLANLYKLYKEFQDLSSSTQSKLETILSARTPFFGSRSRDEKEVEGEVESEKNYNSFSRKDETQDPLFDTFQKFGGEEPQANDSITIEEKFILYPQSEHIEDSEELTSQAPESQVHYQPPEEGADEAILPLTPEDHEREKETLKINFKPLKIKVEKGDYVGEEEELAHGENGLILRSYSLNSSNNDTNDYEDFNQSNSYHSDEDIKPPGSLDSSERRDSNSSNSNNIWGNGNSQDLNHQGTSEDGRSGGPQKKRRGRPRKSENPRAYLPKPKDPDFIIEDSEEDQVKSDDSEDEDFVPRSPEPKSKRPRASTSKGPLIRGPYGPRKRQGPSMQKTLEQIQQNVQRLQSEAPPNKKVFNLSSSDLLSRAQMIARRPRRSLLNPNHGLAPHKPDRPHLRPLPNLIGTPKLPDIFIKSVSGGGGGVSQPQNLQIQSIMQNLLGKRSRKRSTNESELKITQVVSQNHSNLSILKSPSDKMQGFNCKSPNCSEQFSTTSELEAHHAQEDETFPHRCKFCLWPFRGSFMKETHEKKNHTGPSIFCKMCKKHFVKIEVAFQHLDTAHRYSASEYYCSICNVRYTRGWSMLMHFQSAFHKGKQGEGGVHQNNSTPSDIKPNITITNALNSKPEEFFTKNNSIEITPTIITSGVSHIPSISLQNNHSNSIQTFTGSSSMKIIAYNSQNPFPNHSPFKSPPIPNHAKKNSAVQITVQPSLNHLINDGSSKEEVEEEKLFVHPNKQIKIFRKLPALKPIPSNETPS